MCDFGPTQKLSGGGPLSDKWLRAPVAHQPSSNVTGARSAAIHPSRLDMLNRIANDNLATQISCSWYSLGSPPGAEQIFQQMAAQGQCFFTASGDTDAYGSFIPFPDSPSITQVGGTT